MSKTIKLTNAILKERMTDAMVNRGNCVDFDTCFHSGIYGVTPATANIPPGVAQWGVLKVEVSSTYIIHSYTTRSQPITILQRTIGTQGQEASPWYRMATGEAL
ncbi:MAG: hypothetical protein K2K25_12200 [Muribaculaceae bacterium]|nr:hypothetical protein [Muribaculaceae bacterium]